MAAIYAGGLPVWRPGGGGGGGGENGTTSYLGAPGNAGKVRLLYTATGTPTDTVVRFVLSVPDTGCVDNAVILKATLDSSNLDYIECYYGTGGKLGFKGNYSSSDQFDSGKLSFSADGQPLIVSLELSTNGSDLAWTIDAITPGATSTLDPSGNSGTYTSGVIGSVTQVDVNPAGTIDDTAVGMIVVQYVNEDMISSGLANAFAGHDGELGGERFIRLLVEENLSGTLHGDYDDTPYMGPQRNGKFTEVLQEIEDADQGLMYEPRDTLGIDYRTRASLVSQRDPVNFDYSASVFAEELRPVTDDSLTRNDVTVTRIDGGAAHLVLDSGSLSNQDPPNGVGPYTYSLSANLNSDPQVVPLAEHIIEKGTVDELRYPSVVFDMRRAEVASLFDVIPGLDAGDYFTITNMPSYGDPSTSVDQLSVGFDETLNAFRWRIEINAVPESPYELNFLDLGESGSTDNSDFEGSTWTWSTAACTAVQTTATSYSGSGALQITANGTTAFAVYHLDTATAADVINYGLPVAEGDVVYASAQVKAASTTRPVYVGISWYDSSGSFLSSDIGDSSSDSTSWRLRSCQATAPASAAYAVVFALWSSGTSGDVHYMDNAQLMSGWW